MGVPFFVTYTSCRSACNLSAMVRGPKQDDRVESITNSGEGPIYK